MTHKFIRIWFMLIAMPAFLLPLSSTAQDKDYGTHRDLRISNGIIRELMTDAYGTYDRIDVYGYRLPDYGILFVVVPPYKVDLGFGNLDSAMAILDSSMADLHSSMVHIDSTWLQRFDTLRNRYNSGPRPGGSYSPRAMVRPVPRVRFHDRMEHQVQDYSEGQYKAVMEFLETYADVQNVLKPSEDIDVAILPDGETPGRLFEVSKKDIAQLRADAITEEQFREKVRITDGKDKQEEKSVSIMETILDKSLNDRAGNQFLSLPGSSPNGIYLKGLGVLFVCRISDFRFGTNFAAERAYKKSDVESLEKQLVQTLGDYGSSLRFLTSGESIFVLLDLDSYFSGGERILLSLKKGDVDQYSRNEINLDALLRRATVVEN